MCRQISIFTFKNAVDAEDRKRYKFVNDIVAKVEQRAVKSAEINKQDAMDKVLLNPIAGIVIFAAVMWFVFWVSQAWLGPLVADWLVGYIEMFQEWVAGQLENSPAIYFLISSSEGLRIHGTCRSYDL